MDGGRTDQMIRTPVKRENKKRGEKEVTRGREEEKSTPEPVQAGVKHITSLQTGTMTSEKMWSIVRNPDVTAQDLQAVPFMYVQAEMIRRAGEISMVAECSDLAEEDAEILRKAARTIVTCAVEVTIRALPMIVMERRLEILEAENKALRNEDIRCFDTMQQMLTEFCCSLTRVGEEREKEVSSGLIARRTETKVSDPQVPREVPGEGKAAAMDRQTVEKKATGKKNRKRQSKKITPQIEKKRKAPQRRSENKKKRNRKLALPRRPRTSAVTITINKETDKSYAEVLATVRNNIDLDKIGIKSINMRKTMTGGVILEVLEDQKREKAAALAAQLTKILDPDLIRVATPYRTAEARVVHIDISPTADEIKEILAQEGGCKVEDIQLGEIRISENGLGSVWMRCPVEAVRKLIQLGKVTIGRSRAKIEAIEQRPLQCFRCLEIGHVKKSCTSKENREHLCYRCGIPGHLAKECTAAKPKCPLCKSRGASATHRMGGSFCTFSRKGTRKTILIASKLSDGSAVKNWNKEDSPQEIPAPAPANEPCI